MIQLEDIEIPEKDTEFKATTAGGPGGQTYKRSSAVQITHHTNRHTVHCSREKPIKQNKSNADIKGKLWKIEETDRRNKNIRGL